MQDEGQSLVEVVLRESHDAFVEHNRGRPAFRDIRHGLTDVLQPGGGSGRDAVVHRDDQGLAPSEDPSQSYFLPDGRHGQPVRIRSTDRMRTTYFKAAFSGVRKSASGQMPARTCTIVRSSGVADGRLDHAIIACGDLRRTSGRISVSYWSGSGTDITPNE